MISSDAPRRARLDTLAGSGGFRPAVRFGGPPQPPDPRECDLAERQRIESDAFARGFEEGRKSAMTEAEEIAAREDAAREKLGAHLQIIGSEDERWLSQRLRDIALALCSETLAPIAVDEAAPASPCYARPKNASFICTPTISHLSILNWPER